MRINKIKLFNISSYYGLSELDFSVSKNQNIILIGGLNGSGKTSLFTAIKLALYGPLCFNFQSRNNQYTARIKELINYDAFSQADVKAFIELELALPMNNKVNNYTIKREWIYQDNKITEQAIVQENGNLLSEQAFDQFQNYLYNVVPPNLFEFFFFDGEEIAKFFASPRYYNYIKDAILNINSYDTFGHIEKFSKRYVISQDDTKKHADLYEEYESNNAILDKKEETLLQFEETILQYKQDIDDFEKQIGEAKEKFHKSGGLTEKELQQLQRQGSEWEKKRERANSVLKNFVEDELPLQILKPVSDELQSQLLIEDEVKKFNLVKQAVSPESLNKVMKELAAEFGISDTEHFSRCLSDSISHSIQSVDAPIRHDLSTEQLQTIMNAQYHINAISLEEIISCIELKQQATKEISRIKHILDSSISEDDLRAYEKKLKDLAACKTEAERQYEAHKQALGDYEAQLEALTKRNESIRGTLSGLTRKLNAMEYTKNIQKMMQHMTLNLLQTKRAAIEKETLQHLNKILRKENFIRHIELNERFQFSLFREQVYTFGEIVALFKNIGLENLFYRIGKKGSQILKNALRVSSDKELKQCLKVNGGQVTVFDDQTFSLYRRIEFQQLSKGEKQIFILSLYWSIIKSANRDIPFMIDTPFARIDMEHREHIAKEFFPNISNQVIIFSTDEEISRQYYEAVSPYIAQEYTLLYDENEGRTKVLSGYFTEREKYDI